MGAAGPPQFIVGTPNDLTSGASVHRGNRDVVVFVACRCRRSECIERSRPSRFRRARTSSTADPVPIPVTSISPSRDDHRRRQAERLRRRRASSDPAIASSTSPPPRPSVTIRGMRMSGGNSGNNSGGGIRTAAGSNSDPRGEHRHGNSAKEGAGVHNSGTLTVDRSTLSGNTSSGKGGGLFNAGTATVRNSTINGNSAGGGGGIASSSTGADRSLRTSRATTPTTRTVAAFSASVARSW